MARHFLDLAVEAVAAELAAELTSAINTIEASTSLTITDPVAVVRARVPYDGRSPLVLVYDEGSRVEGGAAQRNGLHVVDVTVAVSYLGTADVEASERIARLYIEAIRNIIVANPTFDGQVISAVITDTEAEAALGPESRIHHMRTLGVEVRTYQ